MREYKGKRINTGEWVTGCYIFSYDNDEYYIATSFLNGDTENLLNVCAYPVDPSTVGQYTGKDDQRGNPIFCHDKIDDMHGNEAVIIFDPHSCQFLADFGAIIEPREINFPCMITGNIFDKK